MMAIGAGVAFGIVTTRHDPSYRGSWPIRLAVGLTAIVTVAGSAFFIGSGAVRFWNALHERHIQLTVQERHRERYDGSTTHVVDDTQGRRFYAEPATYKAIEKGDDVECRVATEPLGPDRLLSCKQHKR